MITQCRSTNGCPCRECGKGCCQDMWLTDTEKLCDKAREHCERCALEYGEEFESEVAENE